jgi:negative regulator of flagellin synthesis FlgM
VGQESVVTNKIGSGGVDNRPVQVATEKSVKRVKDASGAASSAADQASSGNSGVQITDSARQLAALEQAINAAPEVNESKVAGIQNAISNGSYQVSPERIADKLIRTESELLGVSR